MSLGSAVTGNQLTSNDSTRRRLLETAATLLCKDSGASLAEVAAAAGIGRTTLHRYFPSRHDLLYALADDALIRVEEAVSKALPGSDEPVETCCKWANACGAFAVSRLLCSPESPTFAELQFFLKQGSPHRALRHDVAINHVHWATTRRPQADTLMALAIDHRAQVEAMADEAGVPRERIPAFKRLFEVVPASFQPGRRRGFRQ